jgi:hypothetical protein
MAAPFWIAAGLAGSSLVFLLRKQGRENGRFYSSALLALPFILAPIEGTGSTELSWQLVTRETVVNASPEALWPNLLSIPAIRTDEGQWNATQDLLGIPKPTEARLAKRQGKFVRLATWGRNVRFEEQITNVRPLRTLSWSFAFPDRSVQEHTDRHISPKGYHLDITAGRYVLEPLSNATTRVTLQTRYALRSPINLYASWWGNLLLGDIQENVLAIVKQRAEAAATSARRSPARHHI